ncbi:MAG TPA: hypothetical protein VGK59_05525 [Ohtaekwangia sp.]
MAEVLSQFPLRGTAGNCVYRSWGGKTFMYARPRKPTKQSAAQAGNRHKFRAAAAMAKHRLNDPEVLQHYRQEAARLKMPNAYTVLLRELMKQG